MAGVIVGRAAVGLQLGSPRRRAPLGAAWSAASHGAPAPVATPERAIGSCLGRHRPWGSAQVSTPPPRRASPAAAAIPWPELLKLDADGMHRCWSVSDEAGLVATVATGLWGGSPAWEEEGVAGLGGGGGHRLGRGKVWHRRQRKKKERRKKKLTCGPHM